MSDRDFLLGSRITRSAISTPLSDARREVIRPTQRHAERGHHWPASPVWLAALAYLALISTAELVTSFTDPRVGMIAHAILLGVLIVHASFAEGRSQRLLMVLFIAPLTRILSLSLPLEDVALEYWYAIVAVPLLGSAIWVARMLEWSRRDIGLTLGFPPTQLAIAAIGFGLGALEYVILKPEPLIDNLTLASFWAPALILLIGTGFTEEFIFRGLMQKAGREALGWLGPVYVAAVFAVLHIGYQSAADVAFVFAVGLLFAGLVARTRSISGVTMAHGITNIMLYLVLPFSALAG